MNTNRISKQTVRVAGSQSDDDQIHGLQLFSVLAALMITLLLEALDQTIVGTALPRIVDHFRGFDRYTWVTTAYLLASITMIPIIGKLSDQFGRKGFMIAGVTLFMVGSLFSGLSMTMNQLIVSRSVQGLGAGMGIALVFTLLGDIFPPAKQARWQGIFAGVYGFSNLVGPVTGGWLTDHGPLLGTLVTESMRWRWVFLINIPLSVLTLTMLLIYLPPNLSSQHHRGNSLLKSWREFRRIDFLGTILVSLATIALLVGLTWGGSGIYPWDSVQIICVFGASALSYLSLFVVERFASEPILPPSLFRNRVFIVDTTLALLVGMVLMPVVIYLPLYLQGVLGKTATESGLAITPLTISLVIGSASTGFALAKMGRYRVITIAGAALTAIGIFPMTQLTTVIPLLELGGFMVVLGIGLGVFFGMLTVVAQNSLPNKDKGVGTGIVTYSRSLGQILGLAVVGMVTNSNVGGVTAGRLQLSNFITSVVSLQHGFSVVFVFGVILFLTSLFLKDSPLAKSWSESESH